MKFLLWPRTLERFVRGRPGSGVVWVSREGFPTRRGF
jgi:hypothetical protein